MDKTRGTTTMIGDDRLQDHAFQSCRYFQSLSIEYAPLLRRVGGRSPIVRLKQTQILSKAYYVALVRNKPSSVNPRDMHTPGSVMPGTGMPHMLKSRTKGGSTQQLRICGKTTKAFPTSTSWPLTMSEKAMWSFKFDLMQGYSHFINSKWGRNVGKMEDHPAQVYIASLEMR
ncbi:hypothetical protein PCH_Pc12g10560 [Penicillium rubens Wisconsin 54-1255]|uniref:Uncharacterized protein n=1 Tax=Penicillium rubens (strain ATCC 28089 / DSM 1075 / NRRL 1951 / Wisconsin 54-1255) TaxID=500485 RepID=B6H0R4_PENRW|nr:hypothetical protein PCH_Pc12g10560 [Penicillium rubens Wisconsin 54-1255]